MGLWVNHGRPKTSPFGRRVLCCPGDWDTTHYSVVSEKSTVYFGHSTVCGKRRLCWRDSLLRLEIVRRISHRRRRRAEFRSILLGRGASDPARMPARLFPVQRTSSRLCGEILGGDPMSSRLL